MKNNNKKDNMKKQNSRNKANKNKWINSIKGKMCIVERNQRINGVNLLKLIRTQTKK